MSRLHWITGVGWYSIFFAIITGYLSRVSHGAYAWIFGVLFIIGILFIIGRFLRWNGSPWRRIHYRGMFLYSHVAGKEAGLAAIEKREFDIMNACRQLLYSYIGNHDYSTANEMAQVIEEKQGELYYNILDGHIRDLYPKASAVDIDKLLFSTLQEEINPRMAIACLVLNKYGPREAAKYVMAVLNGEAN